MNLSLNVDLFNMIYEVRGGYIAFHTEIRGGGKTSARPTSSIRSMELHGFILYISIIPPPPLPNLRNQANKVEAGGAFPRPQKGVGTRALTLKFWGLNSFVLVLM